jgi:hypothetical protein
MLCASAVGSGIDIANSRVPNLLIAITLDQGATVAANLCWLVWQLLADYEGDNTVASTWTLFKAFLFGIFLFWT